MSEHVTPMSEEVATETAREIMATAFRDPTPVPKIGTTPPVPQPGRPPMSQKAVDTSTIMLSASAATIPPGVIAIGAMLASGYADATVIGMICAAPAIAAVPIFAIARLLRGAKPEPDVHQHFHGAVTQHTTHTENRGVWAKNINRN
ncbi:hypothetical protein OH540_09385 [Streptomyces sp. BPPL-273]|uniref:hypothetical protein n=1 Tax=Streptomyces sp. BPPL-273 TaxID=2987533 RepID=UPI0024AFCFE8|nr:hypothetical protein [Streptomyces sp. BPPL-273]WHM30234.1 hypothetical protein OH540_09385 [Streptomyces sp. BPPL-273]